MMSMIPEPLDGGGLREGRARRGGIVIGAIVLLIAAVSLFAWYAKPAPSIDDTPTEQAIARIDADAMAPAGVRVRVRVVNTTDTRGLARKVSNYVRDLGFDVVDYGSERSAAPESTVVLVHTGNEDWGARLARGVNTTIVRQVPDSLRYVDLTLRIGRDWKPPTQPFRP